MWGNPTLLSFHENVKELLDRYLLHVQQHKNQTFSCQAQWLTWLEDHSITNTRHQRIATEGALLGVFCSMAYVMIWPS